MKKIIKNQKGAALPLVLMTLMVLSIFTMTVIYLSTTNFKVATVEANKVKAYYIARTGAEALADYIVKNPEYMNDLNVAGAIGLEDKLESKNGKKSIPVDFGDGMVSVRVTKVKNDVGYKVTGIGKVGESIESTSVVIVPKDKNNLYRDRSLLSLDNTQKMQIGSVGKVDSDSFISGLVQTNYKTIQFDKEQNKKDIKWQVNAGINILKNPNFKIFSENYEGLEKSNVGYEINIDKFDGNGGTKKHYTLFKSDKLNEIDLKATNILEINTSEKNKDIDIHVKGKININNSELIIKTNKERTVNIYADNIQLQNNAKLIIEGAGNVNIISKNNIQIHSLVEIINKEPQENDIKFLAKNKIQIDGNSQLKFKNNQNIFFYSEGEIQIQDDSTVTADEKQNIYFHSKKIQLDKINLTANNKSKVNFFVDEGKFQTGQDSVLITDSVSNKLPEKGKDVTKDNEQENNEMSQIFVVVGGAGGVQIGQSSTFHGYVYAPQSDIQINQNSKLRGSFIGKKIQTNQSIRLEHNFPTRKDMESLDGIIPSTSLYEAVRRME